ncbi:MAG: nodulation protein NfeD [Alphaproteobacteria bacterium]|nr:nodulation protein NfeD [Alphaproteobacteria bacterium]
MLHKLLTAILVLFTLQEASAKLAIQLNIDGAIGPAAQDYIRDGITYAQEKKADFILLKINTPGGLDTAMRNINASILASPLPFVTYVAPEGSRAASAGTYILYASHIAAMAPSTHLGAATPVSIEPLSMETPKEKGLKDQTTMEKKSINDSAAYIKGLANLRGRNAQWAEKMVIESASLQSDEALRLGVIDVVASNTSDLFQQINGLNISVQNQPYQIDSKDVHIENFDWDWRLKFLEVITDPSIAYILLMIGIWGLFFEFVNPGFILPGVIGGISLLMALYAFQLLPIDYTGLALIILGILFMGSELFVTSYGVLGIGGVIAFVIGSILLFDQKDYSPPWTIIIGMSAISLTFFLGVIGFAIQARKRKVVSGKEALPSTIAIVQEDFKTKGWVRVEGELWKARTTIPLQKGEEVQIIKCEGLELTVKPLKSKGQKHV